MAEQFVGSGWAFPMRISPTGGIALVSGEREIEEAMRLVLATAPGERPMRPEFGCSIHDHVFDELDAATLGEMDRAIRSALARWEPRIEVTAVHFDLMEAAYGRVLIDVTYRLRATNSIRNLVHPFYVIPAEEQEIPA
jgi:phage baseplate assembly protein W